MLKARDHTDRRAFLRLSGSPMKLVTLRKRSEFLRLRGGNRWSCPAFAMETKPRDDRIQFQAITGPRFGFTVTKKLGNAVIRNRIRRRLKAAVSNLSEDSANANSDYVIVARAPALDMDFSELSGHLKRALQRIHEPRQAGSDYTKRRSGNRKGQSPHRAERDQTMQNNDKP